MTEPRTLPAHEFPDGFVAWLTPLFEARSRFLDGLGPVEGWVCGAVVAAYIEDGQGPSVEALCAASPHPPEAVEAALRFLDERDLLVLENGRVLAFYPFSDRPCPHRVVVGGRRLDAM